MKDLNKLSRLELVNELNKRDKEYLVEWSMTLKDHPRDCNGCEHWRHNEGE